MRHDINTIFDFIKINDIKFIDFRFSDVKGKFYHQTKYTKALSQQDFIKGVLFDSSFLHNLAENSNLILKPDLSTVRQDPFTALPTLVIICDIIDSTTDQPYLYDPRATAKRAHALIKASNIVDKILFGLDFTFYIFDSVRYSVKENESYFYLDSLEGLYNSGRNYDYGNQGHRNSVNQAYLSTPPLDTLQDLRNEILETLQSSEVMPVTHSHAKATSQASILLQPEEILTASDNMQLCKYIVKNTVASYGKSATFMPKPSARNKGNRLQCSQSLWQDNINLITSPGTNLKVSQMGLYYIGGLLKHAPALNAFTNSITNSYRILCEEQEGSVNGYSCEDNRGGIKLDTQDNQNANIKLCYPDTAMNPYYGLSAIWLAGLDGIMNKIDPGLPIQKNIPATQNQNLCFSLEEALEALKNDSDFLKVGNVFTDEQINYYISLKYEEIKEQRCHPTPFEFLKYYSI